MEPGQNGIHWTQAGSVVLLFADLLMERRSAGILIPVRNSDVTDYLKLQNWPLPALSAILTMTTGALRPLSDPSQVLKTQFAPVL